MSKKILLAQSVEELKFILSNIKKMDTVCVPLNLSTQLYCIINKTYHLLPYSFIFGYGFAWFSHYFFEKNKPATFRYPLYSFIGDWVMLKDIIIGKIKLSK